jgi:MFS family permease
VPRPPTSARSPRARLDAWLPPGGDIRRLVVASFTDSLGTGLFLAGSALFFSRVLGLSAVEIGVGLSLAGLAGVVATVPIGRLADRLGGRRTLVGLYLWRGACFTAYPFAHEPRIFYLVAFLIGAAEFGGGPIVQSLVGAVEQADARVRTMGVIFTVRNSGFAIGAVLATVTVATANTRLFAGLVFADAATFFGAAALLSRLPSTPGSTHRGGRVRRAGPRLVNPRFLALTGLNGVLFLHTVLLAIGLPLWIATRTHAPTALVGTVVVVNTVLAITLQVPLSGGADTVRGAAARQRRSGWCLAATCLLVAAAAQVGAAAASALVVAAAVTLTLGEIWQLAGGWRLSFALAPADQRGYYLAMYETGPSAATAVGPILLTWAVIRHGAGGWLGLAAVFALVGTAIVLTAAGADEVGQVDGVGADATPDTTGATDISGGPATTATAEHAPAAEPTAARIAARPTHQ